MSELSDESSEPELLNRSLSMWHGLGAQVNREELDVPLDLHTAASIGQYEVVKECVQRRELDLNKKNGGGWTPLMYASYTGHDTIVHMLLEAGVSVNVPTPGGQTPLMLASSCGNESIAYFLLQQGAELEMKDIQGWTTLFHCTSAGHQQMVKFLLESGANANVREPVYGFTPLMEAAASGHEIIVQYFLNHSMGVDSVRNLLGQNLGDLQKARNHPNIILWKHSHNMSDLSELGLDSSPTLAYVTNRPPNTAYPPSNLIHSLDLPGSDDVSHSSGSPPVHLGYLSLAAVLSSSLLWLLLCQLPLGQMDTTHRTLGPWPLPMALTRGSQTPEYQIQEKRSC